MAKIWLTRAELRRMIAEDAKLTDDWSTMFPEDQPPKKVPAQTSTRKTGNEYHPFKGKLPEMPPHQNKALEPEEWEDVDISDLDFPGQKREPVMMKGDVRKSRFVGTPPKAKQPYTKQELSAGLDIEPTPQKKGVFDRVKNMFGMGKKTAEQPAQPRVNTNPRDLNALRSDFEKYRSMFRSAEESHDVKKSAYAKKRMQQAHKAWKDAGGQK